MGLGTALAAGMNAYQTEDNRLQKNEMANRKEDRLDKTFTENARIREQQGKLAKAKLAEYSSPEAAKLRALQVKNQTSVELGKAGLYADMEKYNQGQNSQEAVNIAKQTETKVKDMGMQRTMYEGMNNIYTDIAASGKVSNLDSVNAMVEAEPLFQTKIKGKLISYNPNVPKHKSNLMMLAQQQAKRNGGEPEDYFPALEQMAKNNIIAFDSSNDAPIDITALGAVTGITKKLPPSMVAKARQNMDSSATKAMQDYKGQVPDRSSQATNISAIPEEPIAGVTDIAPWKLDENKSELQTWQGKNPSKELMKFQAYGVAIPPDLQKAYDDNVKSLESGGAGYWAGASQQQMVEGIDNIIDVVENGGAVTTQMVGRAKTGIASLETAGQKNDYTKRLDAALDNNRVKDIFKSEMATNKDHNFMMNLETDRVNNAGSKSVVAKKREELRTNNGFVEDINGALKEMSEMDGQMLSGFLATSARETMAKDPSFIKDLAELRVGDDSKAAIAEADKLRKQVYNSLKMNTKVGVMLAKYIKSVSGAAVSDDERTFLTGLMQGAIDANPRAMAVSLQAFRDTMAADVSRDANDFHWQSMLPETTYNMKGVLEDSNIDYASSMPEGVAIATDTYDKATSSFGKAYDSFISKMKDIKDPSRVTDRKNAATAERLKDMPPPKDASKGAWIKKEWLD